MRESDQRSRSREKDKLEPASQPGQAWMEHRIQFPSVTASSARRERVDKYYTSHAADTGRHYSSSLPLLLFPPLPLPIIPCLAPARRLLVLHHRRRAAAPPHPLQVRLRSSLLRRTFLAKWRLPASAWHAASELLLASLPSRRSARSRRRYRCVLSICGPPPRCDADRCFRFRICAFCSPLCMSSIPSLSLFALPFITYQSICLLFIYL